MTTEEIAKAYDEAKERMKDFLKELEDCGAVGEAMEKARNVFPELKENENERIRKELLNYLYDVHDDDEERARWIAYLERQGEQKSIKDQQKEIDYAYRRGLADCHKAFNTEPSETDFIRKEIYDIIAALPLSDKRIGMLLWLESQKFYTATNKQKPVECSDDERIRKALTNWFKECHWDAIDNGKLKKEDIIAYLEKQGEQNSNPVLDIEIPFGAKDSELQGASYYIPEGFHAEIECNRVFIKRGEQKPWSEEDESMLQNILECLKNGWRKLPTDILKYESWLKSLRLQTTWKPSDEQMDALDGICSYIRNKADWEISQDMVSDLYKLSEQLKKLREE